jgi:hypothetical protein
MKRMLVLIAVMLAGSALCLAAPKDESSVQLAEKGKAVATAKASILTEAEITAAKTDAAFQALIRKLNDALIALCAANDDAALGRDAAKKQKDKPKGK